MKKLNNYKEITLKIANRKTKKKKRVNSCVNMNHIEYFK